MNDNRRVDRQTIWHNSLGGSPTDRKDPARFSCIAASQIQAFIAAALEALRNVSFTPDRDLIGDVIDAVGANAGKWPPHEPRHTIHSLVKTITTAKDEKQIEWRNAIVILQAFLLEFSDKIDKGQNFFAKDSESLLKAMLDALRYDLNRLRHSQRTTLAYRIALMMASNYSVIPSRKKRASFIYLLRSLIKYESGYKHPFLEDLVLIYKNMDLGKLERFWEEGVAT